MGSTPNYISGLLNIDKPLGLTSHDVVARLRKLSGQRKVGHTGTLDPLATGVLLVCLGQATRLIEYMMVSRKQYRAIIRFGLTTNTLDAEGQITAEQDPSGLTEPFLRQILPRFKGEIEQVPPIFSALKQDGQPLYKRARAGQTVTVQPRPVTIFALEWVAWQPPDLTLDVTCSAGTYIRSLARDLGQAAGPGAHLAGLIRLANGPWRVEEAVTLATLEQAPDWQVYLQPLDKGIEHLPKIILDDQAATDVSHGRPVILPAEALEPDEAENGLVRAYTPARQFMAILRLADADEGRWQPKKVFHPGG